mgnify:CR=1 FL=1
MEWSKQRIFPVIEKAVSKYAKKLGIETSKISIKSQKNRWGSVSKDGTLNFNHSLIRAPQSILDYVVAHEICHLKVPNHSQSYWRLLHSIMPDYESRKEWLRINKELLAN